MWLARFWTGSYWGRRYWTKEGAPVPGPPLARYTDWARNIATGVPAGGATIAVRDHATDTLSVLYAADGVTLQVNPFTAHATTGVYSWSAANGRYDETVTPVTGEGTPYTNPDILLYLAP
jgi:hypothetical protein